MAPLLGLNTFREQGRHWGARSLTANFPYLFSRIVTRISSIARQKMIFQIPSCPPITSREAAFASNLSSTLCLRRSRICREVGAQSPLFCSPWIDPKKGRKQGTQTVGNATSTECLTFDHSEDICRGVKGVLEDGREKPATLVALPCSQVLH